MTYIYNYEDNPEVAEAIAAELAKLDYQSVKLIRQIISTNHPTLVEPGVLVKTRATTTQINVPEIGDCREHVIASDIRTLLNQGSRYQEHNEAVQAIARRFIDHPQETLGAFNDALKHWEIIRAREESHE